MLRDTLGKRFYFYSKERLSDWKYAVREMK